jgi:hypothetical protein
MTFYNKTRLQSTLFLLLLKITGTVLAPRANKILGQGFALINIAADFANKALFLCLLGLGFNIFMVISVGHRLLFV